MHCSQKEVDLNIIGVYRSSTNTNSNEFISDLMTLIDNHKICIIQGDFNIRYSKDIYHPITSILHDMQFQQLIDQPTHRDGGIIDHAYVFKPSRYEDIIVE